MFSIDSYCWRPLGKGLTNRPHLPFLIHQEYHELLPLHLKHEPIIEAIDADNLILLEFSG